MTRPDIILATAFVISLRNPIPNDVAIVFKKTKAEGETEDATNS